MTTQQSEAGYGSGFDENNGGDDRIEFTPGEGGNSEKGTKPTQVLPGSSSVENIAEGITYTPTIEIRNARFVDANGDNRISRNELCKVVFEVYNNGRQTIYDVQPMVVEATAISSSRPACMWRRLPPDAAYATPHWSRPTTASRPAT